MTTKAKELCKDIAEAMRIMCLDESIKPDEKIAEYKRLASYANNLIWVLEPMEGVNESRSLTPIGADSDTPKASCTKQNHKRLYYQGVKTCSECETTLSP